MCEFKLSQMKGKRPTVLGVKRQYHYWCGHFAPVGAFYTIQVLKEKYNMILKGKNTAFGVIVA